MLTLLGLKIMVPLALVHEVHNKGYLFTRGDMGPGGVGAGCAPFELLQHIIIQMCGTFTKER